MPLAPHVHAFSEEVRCWVHHNKRPFLAGIGIKPSMIRGGTFEFQLGYSGPPPYFGRRWAGMLQSVRVHAGDEGEFRLDGNRVVENTYPWGSDLTGWLVGRAEDLFADQHFHRLLQHLKLAGHTHHPDVIDLPPFGITRRLERADGVWRVGKQVH